MNNKNNVEMMSKTTENTISNNKTFTIIPELKQINYTTYKQTKFKTRTH